MAENIIEILVRSKNEVKEGFAAAKKDAEAAGDEAGLSFANRFGQRLQNSFGSNATGGGGILSSIAGIATSSPEGFVAVAAGIGAAATELTGLITGITAAGLGLGAFGILSAGTFSQLKQDAAQYQTALDNLNNAQNVYAVDPSKKNLAALQKAQVDLKATQMGLGQDAGPAAAGIDQLRLAYDKLSAAISPLTFKVVTDATKAIGDFLPSLLPLAQAGGGALDQVLQSLGKAMSGPGFKTFIHDMAVDAPVAIKQLASLLGMVASDLGHFLELMNQRDVYNAFRIAIDAIDTVLKSLTIGIKLVMTIWNVAWDLMHGRTVAAGNAISSFVKTIPTRILDDLKSLPGLLVRVGEDLIGGLVRGIESGVAGPLVSTIGHVAGAIIHGFGSLLGIHSPSTVFEEFGRQLPAGLVRGILSGTGMTSAAVQRLAGAAMPGGGGYGGAAGGGWMEARVQFVPSGNAVIDAIGNGMRLWVRTNGGGGTNSVQRALGQTH